VLAVLFAALGGLVFGGLPMLVRRGRTRTGDVLAGVVVQSLVGLVVCGAVALVRGQVHGNPLDFFAIGLVVPGLSTILMTRAVREAGPTRVSVLMNASPLLSITAALLLLDEPFQIALVFGAVLIVAGAVSLARERGRPDHVRTLGLVLAGLTGVSFAVRDNLVRWLATGAPARPQLAGAATLAGAGLLSLVAIAVQSGRVDVRDRLAVAAPAFLPAGVGLGLAYVTMYEAFFRGRIGIVSPLLATAAFWGVLLPWLLLRRDEGVDRRLLLAGALVVSGGVLIGIFR
jgi:drug/metabolite transporter (DMT)-like permease